jgi:hypothetical protein
MRLGGGVLGPNSPSRIVRAVNAFGVMAFFYENIYRLADGLEARSRMPFLSTLIQHQAHERRTARALQSS